ncbi:Hypothetical protein SMAX5B_003705 [Scophthalmus maximus]|nr:Hypothetical protein SMAX5B_003705 [Scophthalmus maximus]AWP15323.1 Hypothetical protein SMAX5B_003705 [Scophthalmus maximus]
MSEMRSRQQEDVHVNLRMLFSRFAAKLARDIYPASAELAASRPFVFNCSRRPTTKFRRQAATFANQRRSCARQPARLSKRVADVELRPTCWIGVCWRRESNG